MFHKNVKLDKAVTRRGQPGGRFRTAELYIKALIHFEKNSSTRSSPPKKKKKIVTPNRNRL